ncbi:TPA: cyclic nucleotide-binding domain-containing protein [Candidatus Poribacteria bacterium]|nr:cyclic nucleotide-binding domain-containing protein [Candidatus Poribacteria bacterium]
MHQNPTDNMGIMSETEYCDGLWDSVAGRTDRKQVERDTIDILKQIQIFDGLSNRELRNFARIDSAGMYVILDGAVKVTREVEDSTIITLTTLEDGTFFGDVGLLDSAPRTATVTAIQPSKIIGFFRPELLNLIESDPKLASKVIFVLARVLASRLRFTNQELQKAQYEIDRLQNLTQEIKTKTEDSHQSVEDFKIKTEE